MKYTILALESQAKTWQRSYISYNDVVVVVNVSKSEKDFTTFLYDYEYISSPANIRDYILF